MEFMKIRFIFSHGKRRTTISSCWKEHMFLTGTHYNEWIVRMIYYKYFNLDTIADFVCTALSSDEVSFIVCWKFIHFGWTCPYRWDFNFTKCLNNLNFFLYPLKLLQTFLTKFKLSQFGKRFFSTRITRQWW